MPLANRKLIVTIAMPGSPVVLDESIDMVVNIHKDALALQQHCSIDIANLSTAFREGLLSKFTAWNKRNVETSNQSDPDNPYRAAYINVTVEAGYQQNGVVQKATVFIGQIVLVTPTTSPPTIGVRIECFSQQINKVSQVTGFAPASSTFADYVKWVAAQMGVDRYYCNTKFDQQLVSNPSAQTAIIGNLIIDVQNSYKPNVMAYIDNNVLYVKDLNAAITSANTANVTEFIGIPQWTEWGVEFRCLFDPSITLAGAANLTSKMNPSLNGPYVLYSLDYNLASRRQQFYVRAAGSPPAS